MIFKQLFYVLFLIVVFYLLNAIFIISFRCWIKFYFLFLFVNICADRSRSHSHSHSHSYSHSHSHSHSPPTFAKKKKQSLPIDESIAALSYSYIGGRSRSIRSFLIRLAEHIYFYRIKLIIYSFNFLIKLLSLLLSYLGFKMDCFY